MGEPLPAATLLGRTALGLILLLLLLMVNTAA
jgi:hypothetical protein